MKQPAKTAGSGGAPAEPAEKKQDRETPLEFIASTVATIVVVMFIITFNLQAFAIPTGSMVSTLLIGDHVFVDRLAFAPPTRFARFLPYRQIRRDDIIVFFKPGEPDLHLVKRAVGVPGDRIHLRRGLLYVNGVAQQEPYVIHSIGDDNPYRDEFPAVEPGEFEPVTPSWRAEISAHIQGEDLVVPPGFYFAMGDNRDNSLDSRYWGFVPRENIIGTPLFVYWSFDAPTSEYLNTSLIGRLGSGFDVVLHFFDHTRWRRMLHRIS